MNLLSFSSPSQHSTSIPRLPWRCYCQEAMWPGLGLFFNFLWVILVQWRCLVLVFGRHNVSVVWVLTYCVLETENADTPFLPFGSLLVKT